MIISSSDRMYLLIFRFRVENVSQEICKAFAHILEDLLQSEGQGACNRHLLGVYPFFSSLHFQFCQGSAIADIIFWSRCPSQFSIEDLSWWYFKVAWNDICFAFEWYSKSFWNLGKWFWWYRDSPSIFLRTKVQLNFSYFVGWDIRVSVLTRFVDN